MLCGASGRTAVAESKLGFFGAHGDNTVAMTSGLDQGLGDLLVKVIIMIIMMIYYFEGGIRVGRLSWSATRPNVVNIIVSGIHREGSLSSR